MPDAELHRIDFLQSPDKATWYMLTRCLDAIPNQRGGAWQSWGSYDYFDYFLRWLLYGFHHAGQPDAPTEPMGCDGASERLQKTLELELWLTNPYDYFGDMLAENAYGKRQGFYPTPHSIAALMAGMMFTGGDTRTKTVCDPCVGTGRLLLYASNHSLRLFGQDIDPVMCRTTLVNGYLFAPWLVRPCPSST